MAEDAAVAAGEKLDQIQHHVLPAAERKRAWRLKNKARSREINRAAKAKRQDAQDAQDGI